LEFSGNTDSYIQFASYGGSLRAVVIPLSKYPSLRLRVLINDFGNQTMPIVKVLLKVAYRQNELGKSINLDFPYCSWKKKAVPYISAQTSALK
jgi:hypothetical protein